MRRRRGLIRIAFIFAIVLMAVTGGAGADALSIDFESYAPGTIHGQDGWSSSGPYDHAVVDNTGATYSYPSFADRSFRISNAVTSGSFGDHTFSKPLVDEAGEATADNGGMSGGTRQPYFEVSWDFASTVPTAEQPGLSTVASPDRGDGARMSWVQMLDTPTGIDINFFDVQGVDPSGPPAPCFQCANFVMTNVATGLDRTVPHNIKLTMNFIDGESNDIVEVFVDGTLVHTGGSWEDYYTMDTESSPMPPMVSRTVDSILFRTAGAAAPATAGKGWLIDNLSTFSGPVPVLATCGDPDGDGDNHSSFAPEENEDGPISGVVHGIDQAVVIPVVTDDGGVVPEVNCAIIKGTLGL